MNVFDNIKKIASKTAKDAVKVSGDAVEFTKLKFKLAELNDKIDNEYTEIGKAVYKSSFGDDIDSDAIQERCSIINQLKAEVAEVEDEISAVTNKKQCPRCGAKNSSDSIYCSKCGEKISTDNYDEE